MPRATSPKGTLTGLIALAALLTLAPVCRGELMSDASPDLFVTITVAPTPVSKEFLASFPAELSEFMPARQDETNAVASLVPANYRWSFSHGFGQLLPAGKTVPCRTFALSFPNTRAPQIRAKIRAAAPAVSRDPVFQQALQAMGLIIVGSTGQDLSMIFPVPFQSTPANMSNSLSVLDLVSTYATVTVTSDWKIDGIAPAMGRGVVTSYLAGADSTAAKVVAALPYSSQVKDLQDWAGAFASTTFSYDDLVTKAATNMLKGRPDLFKLRPFLGNLPGADNILLDFSRTARTASGPGAYVICWHEGAGLQQVTTVDGYAFPYTKDHNNDQIDVRLTALAAGNFVQLEAGVVRHLLRAWRWRQILTSTQYDPTNAEFGTTQTLLRLNEPLVDYIADKTVENVLAPGSRSIANIETLDSIDMRTLDARIRRSLGRALTPEVAYALLGAKIEGLNSDSFYPCTGQQVDHQLNALLTTTLRAKAPSDKTKANLQQALSLGIYDLLAAGFYRPRRTLPLNDRLLALEAATAWNGPDPTLEADLPWLARATTAVANPPAGSTTVLAHPFALLDGTRLNQVLAALVNAGVEGVTWNTLPTIPKGIKVALLTQESFVGLKGKLNYSKAKYATTAGGASPRMRAAITNAVNVGANPYVPAWYQTWIQDPANAPVTTADDQTYAYITNTHQLDADLATLTVAVTNGSVTCAIVREDPTQPAGVSAVGNNPTSAQVVDALATVRQTIDQCDTSTPEEKAKLKASHLKDLLSTSFRSGEVLQQALWRDFLAGDPAQSPKTRLAALLNAVAVAGAGKVVFNLTNGNVEPINDPNAPAFGAFAPSVTFQVNTTTDQWTTPLTQPTVTSQHPPTTVVCVPAGPYPIGTRNVTWTATDNLGNSSTAQQTVQVVVRTPPVVNCQPANLEVNGPSPTGPQWNGTLTQPTVTTPNTVVSLTPNPAPPFAIGNPVVTWTATDNLGNTATCQQQLTIVHQMGPALGPTQDVTVQANNGRQWNGTLTAPTSLCACGQTPVPQVNPAPPYDIGVHAVTWTATDSYHNSSSVQQNVTVGHTGQPTITGPANLAMMVEIDGGGQWHGSLGTATATCTCGETPQVTPSSNPPFGIGRYTVTWTATDTFGNTASVVQTVTVQHHSSPVITRPPDLTVHADDNNQWDGDLGEATATCACGEALEVTANPQPPFLVGPHAVTWTATDTLGNTASVVQNVTVQSNVSQKKK